MHTKRSQILETFSRKQLDVGGASVDEINALQSEIDFLRALLRKKNIPIPDGPYG